MRTEVTNQPSTTTDPVWRPRLTPRRIALWAVPVLCVVGLLLLSVPPLAAAGHARSAAELAAGPYDAARLAQAAEHMEAALRWMPGEPALLRAQARVAALRNSPQAAVAALEAALAAQPASTITMIELAEAYERIDEPARATILWQRLGLTQAQAIERGIAALMAGDDPAAQRWFARVVAFSAADPALDDVRGRLGAITAGRLSGAPRHLALLQVAGLVAPSQRPVWYQLGLAYLTAGDWRAAYATFGRGLGAADGAVGQSNFYYYMGQIWQYSADEPNFDAAWADYDLAVQADDFRRDRWQIAQVHHLRSVIRANQERWPEALEEAQLTLAANPDHYFGNLGMAIILAALDRPAEALPYAQRATAIDPDRAAGFTRVGVIAVALGDPALARSSFERALTLDPQDTVARQGLDRLP